MLSSLQIEMLIAATVLLFLILSSLRKNRMSVRNSIVWLLLPVVFMLIALLLEPLSTLAHSLGFEIFSNFIFVIVIGSLILVCFYLTIAVSKQQDQIKKLIQEVSLLKKKKK